MAISFYEIVIFFYTLFMLTKDDKIEIRDIMVDVLKETVMPIIENMNETLAEHSTILNEHSAILNEHSAILNEHSTILAEHSLEFNSNAKRFDRIENKLDKHEGMIYKLIEDVDDIKTEMIMGNELRKTIKGNLVIQKKKVDNLEARVVILEKK